MSDDDRTRLAGDADRISPTVELVCRDCNLKMPYQSRYLAEDAAEIHQRANDGHVTHVEPVEMGGEP